MRATDKTIVRLLFGNGAIPTKGAPNFPQTFDFLRYGVSTIDGRYEFTWRGAQGAEQDTNRAVQSTQILWKIKFGPFDDLSIWLVKWAQPRREGASIPSMTFLAMCLCVLQLTYLPTLARGEVGVNPLLPSKRLRQKSDIGPYLFFFFPVVTLLFVCFRLSAPCGSREQVANTVPQYLAQDCAFVGLRRKVRGSRRKAAAGWMASFHFSFPADKGYP